MPSIIGINNCIKLLHSGNYIYGNLNTNHFSVGPNVDMSKRKRLLDQMSHNKKTNLTNQEQWDISFGYELILGDYTHKSELLGGLWFVYLLYLIGSCCLLLLLNLFSCYGLLVTIVFCF